MIGFKLSSRAIAFAAASIFALGLAAATPQEAQAASKTGNFLLGAAAGAAGLAILGNARRNRQPRYYQPRPVRRYYRPAPRRYYRPAAPRRYAPSAWSNAWYQYCGSKYRSFNPNTGYYTTYSGYQKFCR